MPLDADASASLIDLAGTPAFGEKLLGLASSIAGIDEIFGYAIDSNGTSPLVSASRLDRQDERVKEYARRFYRQDPANHGNGPDGVSRNFSRSVRCEQIAQRDYRRICFEEPRFAGKSCFGWRGPQHTLMLNFYSGKEADESVFRELSSLADLSLAALNRRMTPRGEGRMLETIELRLGCEYPLLAPRERQVVARSIMGQKSGDIAEELGTTKGTVLTYRQRAYQKYDMTCAAGFLSRLI